MALALRAHAVQVARPDGQVLDICGTSEGSAAAALSTGAALVAAAAVWRSLSIEWDKTVLYNETNPAGNESGGLLLVAAWLGFLAWRAAGRRPAA